MCSALIRILGSTTLPTYVRLHNLEPHYFSNTKQTHKGRPPSDLKKQLLYSGSCCWQLTGEQKDYKVVSGEK